MMHPTEHNYYRKACGLLEQGQLDLHAGHLHDCGIRHDDWCGILAGGRCDCDPDIPVRQLPCLEEMNADADPFGRGLPTYATMTIGQIADLPVANLAQPNAHLYLWVTNRSLPNGFALLERWGFRYVTCLTWHKSRFGMGNYFRGQSEHVLFGVRGSMPLLRKDVGTVFTGERPGRHSAKPDEFYQLVETCSPGPWLELFARKPRRGWVSWGAEVTTAA
jgi:N6-adenosine-specific RNA methylase IME4